MSPYECVRCGCLYHQAWTPEATPIPCAPHRCTDYAPAFAWTKEGLERYAVAQAARALLEGAEPSAVLGMLVAA